MTITPDHRKALAHLRRKEWDRAHTIVMGMRDKLAFRIHGLVHRIEGDFENARYWYDKAAVPFSKSKSAASEIKEIVALVTARAAAAIRTNTRHSPRKRSGSRRSRA